MARETFYTAIDLGSTKVCTIIAKVGPEGELKVLGTGIVPSQGMQRGRVESIHDTQEAVSASLEEAQRYLGRGVSWAYLGVTGNHITCLNTTGVLNSSRENGAISSLDVQHLIQSSYPEVPGGKEVLHVIPISYAVDGLTGVRNPVGLHADTLQVESHVVLGDTPILKNLVKAVEGCKLSVRSLVLQPLAAAEAILTEGEREMGAVMVDIGGGTTDVVVYRTGSPWFTSVVPVGGNQLTRDLSIALGSPFYIAEELKLKWGHAMPDGVAADEDIQLPGFQGQPRRIIRRRLLCKPLHERLTETMKLVLQKLRQAGLRQLPTGGLVITGGTAELPGMRELAEKLTGATVRIAYPTGILGLPSQLRKPAFSTSVGALLWGIKHQGESRAYRNGERTLWGYKAFLFKFMRRAEKVSV
jgi:cell division protein FtsA